IVTVASCAFAAQIAWLSGDRSKPSAPWPAGTLVTRHVFRGPPGGGPIPGGGPSPGGPPAGGAEPDGALLPGGGPKPLAGGETCSMMLMVPELTLEVTIRSRLSETTTMCVLSCPVPRTQSMHCVAGGERRMAVFVSTAKYSLPAANAQPC